MTCWIDWKSAVVNKTSEIHPFLHRLALPLIQLIASYSISFPLRSDGVYVWFQSGYLEMFRFIYRKLEKGKDYDTDDEEDYLVFPDRFWVVERSTFRWDEEEKTKSGRIIGNNLELVLNESTEVDQEDRNKLKRLFDESIKENFDDNFSVHFQIGYPNPSWDPLSSFSVHFSIAKWRTFSYGRPISKKRHEQPDSYKCFQGSMSFDGLQLRLFKFAYAPYVRRLGEDQCFYEPVIFRFVKNVQELLSLKVIEEGTTPRS